MQSIFLVYLIFSLLTNVLLSLVAVLTLAPLVVKVDSNVNVILTACLTVYVGCYRSVKPTPPTVSSGFYPHCLLCVSPFKSQIKCCHVLTYLNCVI